MKKVKRILLHAISLRHPLRKSKEFTRIEKNVIKNILVIFLGGIGDAVILTPTLRALRKEMPNSTIVVITPSQAAHVIQHDCYLDRVIVYNSSKCKTVDYIKGLVKDFALILEVLTSKYDLIINTRTSFRMLSLLLVRLSNARYKIGYNIEGTAHFYTHPIEADNSKHELDLNLNILDFFGAKEHCRITEYAISQDDLDSAKIFLKEHNLSERKDGHLVGICPGARIVNWRPSKRWDKLKFAQLADQIIQEYNAKIIIFGSKDEIELANEVSSLMNNGVIVQTGKTSLAVATGILSKCDLFISNDTALMHFAASMNIPLVAIFGPTDERRTGPYGSLKDAIILKRDMPCRPCLSKDMYTRCEHINCLNLIGVRDVMKSVSFILKA